MECAEKIGSDGDVVVRRGRFDGDDGHGVSMVSHRWLSVVCSQFSIVARSGCSVFTGNGELITGNSVSIKKWIELIFW